MKRTCRILSRILIVVSIICLAMSLFGCASYTDAQGKQHTVVDVGLGQKVITSPEWQAATNSLPFGTGALVTGGAALLLGYIGKKQNDTRQANTAAIKDIATHAITQAAQAGGAALQQASGLDVSTAPAK